MKQQRQHERLDIRLSAEVHAGDRVFTATTRNMSVGGCCLESAYPLAEDAELRLDLFMVYDGIEDERMPPLTVGGAVQWAAPTDDEQLHLAGVRFSQITEAQTRWLEQFLSRAGTDD